MQEGISVIYVTTNRKRTISCSVIVSFSGVITVLWIRNLSLHLAFGGGSSFIACNMTRRAVKHGLDVRQRYDVPETSTL